MLRWVSQSKQLPRSTWEASDDNTRMWQNLLVDSSRAWQPSLSWCCMRNLNFSTHMSVSKSKISNWRFTMLLWGIKAFNSGFLCVITSLINLLCKSQSSEHNKFVLMVENRIVFILTHIERDANWRDSNYVCQISSKVFITFYYIKHTIET